MNVACPVCDGDSVHYLSVYNYGEMRRCLTCGLIFANPLELPQEPEQLFEEAYLGHVRVRGMDEFHKRTLIQDRVQKFQLQPFLGPAQRVALDWLKGHFPPGSPILDVGCGTGAFLEALGDAGFYPMGIDPANTVIENLRQKDYTVYQGTADDIQGDFPQPVVCTCFLVIHHSPHPLEFLRSIRRRFPKSWLIIADCSDWRHPTRRPPRHLTVWNVQSLSTALFKTGYDAQVKMVTHSAVDISIFGLNLASPISHIRGFKLFYRFYRRVKPALLWPSAVWYKLRRKEEIVLAYAKPRED